MIWKVMQRNAWNDFSNWRIKQHSNSTMLQLHALMTINPKKKKWDLSENCQRFAHIFLKCLYLARIGRPDISWSVNKLARGIIKWTRACDKRSARLIAYIHHTCEFKQCCHVGNTAQQCRLGLFQDSDFAGDLEDSKSTSGELLCIFGSHTFVPVSWMKLKLFLSIQVHAWMDTQLLIFGTWLLKCFILHQTNSTTPKIKYEETRRVTPHPTSTPKNQPRFQPSTTILIWAMLTMSRRTRSFLDFGAMLYIFWG